MNVLRATAHLIVVAAVLLMVSACSQDNVRGVSNAGARPVVADDSIEQMFTEALSHLQQQEYHQGIELLETLTAKENRLTAPFVNLGIAYSRSGNTKRAEYSFAHSDSTPAMLWRTMNSACCIAKPAASKPQNPPI